MNLRNVILYHHYGSSLSASTSGSIYAYSGVNLSPTNTFFGLYYFYSNNNKLSFLMTFTYNPFPQVVIVKDSLNPTYMGVDILVAFRNHCPTPYMYDEI